MVDLRLNSSFNYVFPVAVFADFVGFSTGFPRYFCDRYNGF
jgi:hypothetical protein